MKEVVRMLGLRAIEIIQNYVRMASFLRCFFSLSQHVYICKGAHESIILCILHVYDNPYTLPVCI